MEEVKRIIAEACKRAGLKKQQVEAITARAEKDYHHERIYQLYLGVKGVPYGDAMATVEQLEKNGDVFVLSDYAPMYLKIALVRDWAQNPFVVR